MPNVFVAGRLCNSLRSHDRNILYIYISKISMIFLCDKSGAIGKKVNAQRDIDYGICFSSYEFMENLNIDLLHEKSRNLTRR